MEGITKTSKSIDLLSFLFSQIGESGDAGSKKSGINFKADGFENFLNLLNENRLDEKVSGLTEKPKDINEKFEKVLSLLTEKPKEVNSEIENLLKEVIKESSSSLKIDETKEIKQVENESSVKTPNELITLMKKVNELLENNGENKEKTTIHAEMEKKINTGEIVKAVINEWVKEPKHSKENMNQKIDVNVIDNKTINSKELVTLKHKVEHQQIIKGNVELNNSASDGLKLMDKKTIEFNDGKKEVEILNTKSKNESFKHESLKAETIVPNNQGITQNENKTVLVETNKINIRETVKNGIFENPNSNFKIINPEKIVIQLKPMELGVVEVTIEKNNGEIQVKMNSNDKDVQELLDGLTEEIKEELKARTANDVNEQTMEREQKEKTKEEHIVPKNDNEKEETDSSFEEQLEELLGGFKNGGYIRYQ